jgi:hypothetical protein
VIENRRGRLAHDFRLRAVSGPYHWYRLKARPVVGADGEVIRIVGTMTDVTDAKASEERLLHDAVHDNLTGLPNRQLFLDRIESALSFPAGDVPFRPTVIALDIDRFKQVNESIGHSAGDQILLTLLAAWGDCCGRRTRSPVFRATNSQHSSCPRPTTEGSSVSPTCSARPWPPRSRSRSARSS